MTRPFSKLFSRYYAGGLVKEVVTGLVVDERGFGANKQTILRLTNVALPIVSVTTGNGVGGKKLATFPGGRIAVFGCIAELAVQVGSAKQADFTDNAPEGDLGVGTLAPANADALGTDATDDDLATAAAFTMVTWADNSVVCPPEAYQVIDGHTTAVPIFLNGLVDAADVDDGVTTEVLVTGTITVTWMNLGDHA